MHISVLEKKIYFLLLSINFEKKLSKLASWSRKGGPNVGFDDRASLVNVDHLRMRINFKCGSAENVDPHTIRISWECGSPRNVDQLGVQISLECLKVLID